MRSNLYLFLMLAISPVFGQNLIPNPGFEETTYKNQVVHWYQPPSTNYHHHKPGEYGGPYEGEYTSGICISNMHFSECMFTVLNEPLIAGEKYKISFFARQEPETDDCFNFNACDQIQIYFPKKAPPVLPRKPYPVDESRLIRVSLPDSVINDRIEWKKYETTYTAQGGEQIFAFSYFMRPDTSKPLYIPQEELNGQIAYPSYVKVIDKDGDNPIMEYFGSGDKAFRVRYYFDQVVLRPANPEAHMDKDRMPDKLEPGQKFTLRNIHFEFDSTNLLPSAFPVLDSLTDLIRQNPKVKVRIIAHTDSLGSDAYNQKLSKGRARSVARYLISRGIDKSRLETTGKGESQPINSNATEEGRAMNRRVEFEILKHR